MRMWGRMCRMARLRRRWALKLRASSDGLSTVSTHFYLFMHSPAHSAYSVLRTGLVTGKLSQTSQTFHIIRASARAFEREQWEALEKRLVAWKTGLVGVMEVIANARRQGGAVPVQAQAAAA